MAARKRCAKTLLERTALLVFLSIGSRFRQVALVLVFGSVRLEAKVNVSKLDLVERRTLVFQRHRVHFSPTWMPCFSQRLAMI